MSDTPKTDAAAIYVVSMGADYVASRQWVVDRKFARAQERRIAELEQRLSKERLPGRLTFVLGSGESTTMDKVNTVHWLKHLFEYYNGQEKDWHDKTYNGERTPGGFDQSFENEWMRYRQEAAALAFAIQVISGETP